jgi:thiamine biosynthesis lipoprotein
VLRALRGKSLFLAFLFSVHSFAQAPVSVRVELADDAMGTTFSVVLHGPDRAKLESAGRDALDEAKRLDRLLSNYLSTSELSRVNREAARGPVAVSTELFYFLRAALRYSRESDGAFDMTVGPLMKTWRFYKDEGALPKADEVAKALAQTGYRHVLLDETNKTVRFDVPGIELDPGGIGKGYAVDSMAAVLRQAGVTSALISAGGSSIYAMGSPPGTSTGWSVPIRASDDPNREIARIDLKDASISTSGGYEKFFRAGGKVYSHIMDPRTGNPAQGTIAVSVVAPRTIDSEVWAKPYFINGRRWTEQHMDRSFRVFFCSDTPVRLKPDTAGNTGDCGWIQP